MLSNSISFCDFQKEHLKTYSAEGRISSKDENTVHEIPIMYKYASGKDQPLFLEGPEMHSDTGLKYRSSETGGEATILSFVGYNAPSFVSSEDGVINYIYNTCVNAVWENRRRMQGINRLPSIDCVHSLTSFPFFPKRDLDTGEAYPDSLMSQYVAISPETKFRLPIKTNDGDYVVLPQSLLINTYLSFIPIYEMSKITVTSSKNMNSCVIQMKLRECVVTHISNDIIIQVETLERLEKDRKLIDKLTSQYQKILNTSLSEAYNFQYEE